MEDQRTYYQILGLARSARPEAVKAVYQKLIQLYHPDRASDAQKDEFERIAKDINKAYEILGNASSRSAYDGKLDQEASATSRSQTYTQSATTNPPRGDHGYVHNSRGTGDRSSAEYAEDDEDSLAEARQTYADAKEYVTSTRDCTKRGLKRELEINDDIATLILDQMCRENILYKKTGGRTTYHFVETEEDEADADYNDYEEAPVTSARTARAKPKKDLGGCLAVIFWLVVGGWWGWHHFMSRPVTQTSETSVTSSAATGGDQMVEPQTAHGHPSGDLSNSQTPSTISSTAAGLSRAPASGPTSAPLSDSETMGPQNGSTANIPVPATPTQRQSLSTEPPSADWRIVRETPPNYPITALRSGEFGTTIVEVTLDGTGNIVQAHVQKSSGYRDLDMAAVRAVRMFEFAPTDGSGGGRGGTVLVPINFRQQ